MEELLTKGVELLDVAFGLGLVALLAVVREQIKNAYLKRLALAAIAVVLRLEQQEADVLREAVKRHEPRTLTTLLVVVVGCAAVLSGCTPSLERARAAGQPPTVAATEAGSRDHCERLDKRRVAWGAAATALGATSAGLAAGAIPVQEIQDEDSRTAATIGVATGALVTGSVALGAKYASDRAAADWAAGCSQ